MALISIITPSYNQASFLEETIRSVLGQENVSIEYIIIDGGSTDGSVDIIEKYAEGLACWVSERDSGQAEAINKGLARSTGEFIAWLNSDDLYLPGAVAQATAVLEAHPEVGFVFGDAIIIDTQGRYLNKLTFGDWGLSELMAFRIICQPAVFMRRSVLEQVGYLDTTYHYMLDHQLWLRMARVAPIRHISSTWAAARHHPGAKNVAHPAGFSRETLSILEWMGDQPDLAPLVASNHRRVEAGAYRLNARYLLDGGLPGPALGAYGNALVRSPGFALQHWHRMVYAVLSLAGGKNLGKVYYRMRQQGK
jgi:glycosyltransferase involved in cell wall biosynthesis